MQIFELKPKPNMCSKEKNKHTVPNLTIKTTQLLPSHVEAEIPPIYTLIL